MVNIIRTPASLVMNQHIHVPINQRVQYSSTTGPATPNQFSYSKTLQWKQQDSISRVEKIFTFERSIV